MLFSNYVEKHSTDNEAASFAVREGRDEHR